MVKRFTAETLVADAIAADPAVIDRLVALHPTFKKLKNPLLRKVMARLVTFGDAAKVAGVPLEKILAAANGESPEQEESAAEPEIAPAAEAVAERPAWFAEVDLEGAKRLDVRDMLARGEEPLGDIMRLAATVEVGGALIIESPFEPAPLKRVLGRKGFKSHSEELAAKHWRTVFLRRATADPEPETAPEETGEGARVWTEEDGTHIDVRGLDPPQPMLAIIKLIEAPDTREPVVVHHEREPIFLYPELEERGWSYELVKGAEDDVRLTLRRKAG